MTLKTDKEVRGILNSFNRVFTRGGSQHLTKAAYNFIMLSSGFIAHYNIHGFIAEYSDTSHFAKAILDNQSNNQWNNFRPGERDYDYMMQKKMIYNKICEMAQRFYKEVGGEEYVPSHRSAW